MLMQLKLVYIFILYFYFPISSLLNFFLIFRLVVVVGPLNLLWLRPSGCMLLKNIEEKDIYMLIDDT